ncbi:MAG: uracil-DNA glycosylase [Rickettsiales bacterium]|nr:MAG: uracil-DNA glycosylase [Rickettsiales bacterium]
MLDKNILIEYYLENGIFDIIEEVPFSHIKKIEKPEHKEETMTKIKEKPIENANEKIIYARKLADSATTLEQLKDIVKNFGQLEIEKYAKNVVFGDGNPTSKIMLIGEAPGDNEDQQGIPFCGDSGKLLMNIFEAIDYKRDDLYIANTLFWRPPANRKPTKEELSICKPILEKHIALINPKVIICVGETSLKALIETDLTITKARQNIFEYKNQYLSEAIKVTPIFHPSYLLRSSIKKKDMWHDLIFIKTHI